MVDETIEAFAGDRGKDVRTLGEAALQEVADPVKMSLLDGRRPVVGSGRSAAVDRYHSFNGLLSSDRSLSSGQSLTSDRALDPGHTSVPDRSSAADRFSASDRSPPSDRSPTSGLSA